LKQTAVNNSQNWAEDQRCNTNLQMNWECLEIKFKVMLPPLIELRQLKNQLLTITI